MWQEAHKPKGHFIYYFIHPCNTKGRNKKNSVSASIWTRDVETCIYIHVYVYILSKHSTAVSLYWCHTWIGQQINIGKISKNKDDWVWLGSNCDGQNMALAECPQSAVVSIHQKCSKEVVTQKHGHGQPKLINGHSIQFSFTYIACYNPNSL